MKLQEMAVGRKDLFMVNPKILVEENGWNVRINTPELEAHIKWLAQSIEVEGVKEPLTVYMKDGMPTVTNGHCRLEAVRRLIQKGVEIKAVPVRVEERHGNEADRLLGLLSRNSGRPLQPLETAEVVRRLSAYGWTPKQIAEKTGYSTSQVSNFFEMASWDHELKKYIEGGKVSASLMREQVREKGKAGAKEAVEEATDGGKKKVTRKNLTKRPKDQELPFKKGCMWNHWGPLFLEALRDICSKPIMTAGPSIATGKELIASFEDETGKKA